LKIGKGLAGGYGQGLAEVGLFVGGNLNLLKGKHYHLTFDHEE